jgi:aminobenzoyl-glutamate transport protein
MAATFAGVSGGYSANLLLGTIDPLLAGLSQEAARIISPDYQVSAAANYYFMVVSTFFIAAAGTWVTEKIVVPRLGEYKGGAKPEEIKHLSPEEKKGLIYATITVILFSAFLIIGVAPENGFLRNPETGGILHSPFLEGIVAFIFLSSGLAGIAYGIGSGVYKSDKDVMKGMAKSMETLSIYIVLVFFASQFVAYFKLTNLGLIFAIKGAEFLKASGLGDIPLILSFIILSAIINMFMGSASAKWAIMAPVFIPMFMLLGYTPELVQATYRIGDSVTNIISPMMSFFALIIAFMEKYDERVGIGTVISTMLPYTVAFFIVWSILLIIFMILGIPLGPEAGFYLAN